MNKMSIRTIDGAIREDDLSGMIYCADNLFKTFHIAYAQKLEP